MYKIALPLSLAMLFVLAACGEAPLGDSASRPPEIVSFSPAASAPVAPGSAVTLTWDVQGVSTSLVIEPDVGPVSGTTAEVHPTVTTTYVLTASNALGSTRTETTVEVETPSGNGSPDYPPATPDMPYGEWAFEIVLDGGTSAARVTGTVSLGAPFVYSDLTGVWGEVTACSGPEEVCSALEIGGIYRDEAENVLKFSLGTYDFVPLFVGVDQDGTVAEAGNGSLLVEGEGEVKVPGADEADSVPASFTAQSVLP